MRTRPTLNDPCTGSKRSGFAHAQGRAVSVMDATWAMNVVIFLRNDTRQRHAGQRSNLRLRLRSGDIELVVSKIASLSSIARCSLRTAVRLRDAPDDSARPSPSATSVHKDKGDVRAEAVVGAMIRPDMRRAQYHIHAPDLCLIDRRHFLREMMAERCA
ncbi:[NiFe]-hydrogenase assembly chaperone HybE [Bradyrhizobium brasilense]|uniref:[NiFe]-hydrogenase assembly chaperone HybE n=2 Tax=Bradyrhizobium brasilense TaxID=1419277 RepID=A0ABY8JRD7_9BRAD|nr:[NiFe]-hydrogenase assembly chaperone HybE [Bradyrhizobium brasilense]